MITTTKALFMGYSYSKIWKQKYMRIELLIMLTVTCFEIAQNSNE